MATQIIKILPTLREATLYRGGESRSWNIVVNYHIHRDMIEWVNSMPDTNVSHLASRVDADDRTKIMVIYLESRVALRAFIITWYDRIGVENITWSAFIND